ncbi:MAG TPA: GntR family transcriptional regulator [Nocardioidaceae bacterium]|nr:GntR family transcriptional regulator [Nocardioidaceae bacterium]
MAMHPVERPSSLTELAYGQLRMALLDGQFKAGERLSVVSLAAKLGMSRSPVRAAFERLSSEGLLSQVRGGSGAVVATPSHEDLLDALAVRAALEGLAAELAARRLTDADLAKLQQIHRDFEHSVSRDDTKRARRVDLEFHQYIQGRSGNSVLVEDLERVQAKVILGTYSTAWGSSQHRAVDEHAEILQALVARNADAAAQAATVHLHNLTGRLRDAWAMTNTDTTPQG